MCLLSLFSGALSSERTVKRLRLSKALTIPEGTTVQEACRRMATRKVDAVLLTDSNGLLSGILTDKVNTLSFAIMFSGNSFEIVENMMFFTCLEWKDISTRVIARELKIEETPVSKVMTRNPIFVLSDTLAVEALQKMVQG